MLTLFDKELQFTHELKDDLIHMTYERNAVGSIQKSDSELDLKKVQECNLPNICTSSQWKVYNNVFIPILIIKSNLYNQIGFWTDDIALFVSQKVYCTKCGAETSQQPCLNCQSSLEWKMYRCIFEGAGKPFQSACSLEQPPCGQSTYAEYVCYQEYILYIGRIGRKWKIGMSRYNRSHTDSGYILRLIEQGFDDALTIRSPEKFTLPTAQTMEETLSIQLGIPQSINNYYQKNADFGENYTNNANLTIDKVYQTVKGLYPQFEYEKLVSLKKICLFHPWLPYDHALRLMNESERLNIPKTGLLVFRILATLGDVSLVKVKNRYYSFKRKQLVGRKLVSPTDSYILEENE